MLMCALRLPSSADALSLLCVFDSICSCTACVLHICIENDFLRLPSLRRAACLRSRIMALARASFSSHNNQRRGGTYVLRHNSLQPWIDSAVLSDSLGKSEFMWLSCHGSAKPVSSECKDARCFMETLIPCSFDCLGDPRTEHTACDIQT